MNNIIWRYTVLIIFSLIQASSALATGPYKDNGNTVTDTGTGLEWQKSDDGIKKTWQQALDYCAALPTSGGDTWKLPTFSELRSLVDLSGAGEQAIDPVFDCQASFYWTSTDNPYTAEYAYIVDFVGGLNSYAHKEATEYVRCVRVAGPSNPQYELQVALQGRGSGTVTFNPPGVDCTGNCSQTYYEGEEVTLLADAEPGSDFIEWGGACSGSERICKVTLDANKEVTAEFDKPFGEVGRLVIDYIIGPVDTDSCFPVRIQAFNAFGIQDNTFSGDATLDLNYGQFSPNTIRFYNGVATESCVKVLGEGKNKKLTVHKSGRSGESNFFDTTNTENCHPDLFYVRHNALGVTITLYDAQGIIVDKVTNTSRANYIYLSADTTTGTGPIPCGSYSLELQKDSYKLTLSPIHVNQRGGVYGHWFKFPKPGTKTPVILIPGIMGSTHIGTAFFQKPPYLKGNYPDKNLQIHWPTHTGFNQMQTRIEAAGHTVIPCPWDWRSENKESMEKSVREFLIPAIDTALQYSTDGKVDIVAHSMGGLLARSYIQSSLYRGDVRKLATVATPHLGSANPYYLWQGGDTRTSEKVIGDDFYEKTIKELWESTYGKSHWDSQSCNAPVIRDFLHDKGPGILQLMSTKNILNKYGSPTPVMTDGYVNTWLKALNEGTEVFEKPESVFSSSDNNLVRTRVFVGNLLDPESTLVSISVQEPYGTLYPDGKPIDAFSLDCKSDKDSATNTFNDKGPGDGTVPLESASYPATMGWADQESTVSTVKHARIMTDFREEVVNFLDGTDAGTAQSNLISSANMEAVAQQSDNPPMLAFWVLGEMRLLVTDGYGRKSGTTPDTNEVVNEIPEAEITANDVAASIVIQNPEAGPYQLTYYGFSDSNFTLNVSAVNSTGESTGSTYRGFRPDVAQTAIITYNPEDSNSITIEPPVAAPLELEAEAYSCPSGQCTRLKWKASPSPDITEYVVYHSLANESFYTEFMSFDGNTLRYDTDEPWDSTNDLPVNSYAVSAIAANGLESFFAERKEQDDYRSPWISFLPAILAGSNKKKCFPNLSMPVIAQTGTEQYTVNENSYIRYNLAVANHGIFPDEMFDRLPDSLNGRTTLTIYDNHDSHVYGFLGLEDLDSFWFATRLGEMPPEAVYIKLVDLECNITYLSDLLTIQAR
ncbi:Lecithin:cholesterol acyltransferase [Candidatus Electrothrix marina]|uniref:Lecithin:cholesterol acyltransferase n=1 Tax=Candidatus Electrothrix marina TaxID=1859130 RepID=A0A444JE22_9BACT|nr:Lecithin:cholesterol acyltransferase [Candidatus Electrothrix marina]